MANLRGPCARADVRLADQQGRDPAVRTDLRPNPARLAGLWLSGRGRQGARAGAGHPELVRGGVNQSLRAPGVILRGSLFYGCPMSTALATITDYINDGRTILQDTIAPYRYTDDTLVTAMNVALL